MSGPGSRQRLRLRYYFGRCWPVLLFLLAPCNEAQTVTEEPYAILEPPQSQTIEEGNQNRIVSCLTRGQSGWYVLNSNGESVNNWTERGITSNSSLTDEGTLSYLSIPARRQNYELWVSCYIARDHTIESERVQLFVIDPEETPEPPTVVVTDPTSTTASTSFGVEKTPGPTTEANNDGGDTSGTNVVGIVLGSVVAVLLVIIIVTVVLCYIGYVYTCDFCKRKQRNNGGSKPDVDTPSSAAAHTSTNLQQTSLHIPEPKVKEETSTTPKESRTHELVNSKIGNCKRNDRYQQFNREVTGSVLPQDPKATSVAPQTFKSSTEAKTSVNARYESVSSTQETIDGADEKPGAYFAVTSTEFICRERMVASNSPNTVQLHEPPEDKICDAIDDSTQ